MNLFQVIALLVVALLLAITVASTIRGRATRREGLAWVVVWLATGVAIAWPNVTKKIANLLGIGRGADLVLYCAVVVMLVGFLMVFVRFQRVQRELTLIVRHLAIRDATDTSSLGKKSSSAEKAGPPDDRSPSQGSREGDGSTG